MDQYIFPENQKKMMESLEVPFAVFRLRDNQPEVLVLSRGFCDVFGYEDPGQAYEDMKTDLFRDIHPDDAARAVDAFRLFSAEGGNYEAVYRAKRKDSSEIHVIHARGQHFFTDAGVRLSYLWYMDEGRYTEENSVSGTALLGSLSRALHEESIMREYHYDHLTGLPSMTHFFQLAEAGKNSIVEKGGSAAFVFLDLDGMKLFNAKQGFAQGDNLLRSFAEVLVRTFGGEHCCRIGADHFGVFTSEEGLNRTLSRLFEECRGINHGKTLPVRAGIYLSRMENAAVSTALDRAKVACDALRGTYGSGFNYYRKAFSEDVIRRQYILENLEKALEEKWIQAYYQPIVRAVNGRVCDEEVLARWIDPELGFLSPAEFVPILEDAKLIYRLDLYILEQALEKIRILKKAGLHIVPQSINLSRSDFDSCDIVEEIRSRVDEAGVGRDKITIEITESIIGRNFDYIRNQIRRFRDLGFSVWMDDFGSGYSSLDVLQSVKFDLIKFDMSFMERLDEGDDGKIILTELMKMATSLGVDTVCEGVETAGQVHFLQEIGCSKLQGYYYLRPCPLERILERYEKGQQIGFENPEESAYYDTMGRVNLYDLSFLANRDDNILKNTFDTVPMAVMEVVNGGRGAKYVRSNRAFRDFVKRAFGFDLSDPDKVYQTPESGPGSDFMKSAGGCKDNKNGRAFVDEIMEDGSVVRSFLRLIGENPVTRSFSVAIAVLSVSEPNEGTTYASIARALASEYYNLYYVNIRNGSYIEYGSNTDGIELVVEKRGEDYFGATKLEALPHIYEEDREKLMTFCTADRILHDLNEFGVFNLDYRILENGMPVEVHMKAMRMHNDPTHIIIGVSGQNRAPAR